LIIVPPTLDASRDLLFGLLALQTGLINQVQLFAAFHAWTQARDHPMAEILAEQGAISATCLPLVEGLVMEQLRRHGNDPERSLAAIGVGRSTRKFLAQIGNPCIDASLAHVGSLSTEHCNNPDLTASYSVGAATSDGQRFRVLRPHACGGLGAVFVALDGELNREVALKQILDRHADDPNSRARFLLEAEITGGLEHPGIVPVYGLGAYPDGRPYYAMRFIRGESLKEAIALFHADETSRGDPGRRSLGLLKLMRRFLVVCDAIDYAHSRGILHRDLKPSNVILGKHGETLVVDWGLAKALGRTESDIASDERVLFPSLSSGSAETLPGSALGTPAYMSPEQAQGYLERLGPRSDVYCLGATLYCLLAGRPPVEGDDPGTVLRAVQRGDFPPPRQLDPSIDPALEAVCLKAMALRAEDRYPSPRALAEDIEHWMADEPVAAWREPWTRRARRWERRHRTAVMAAASGLLMALAGMFAVLVVQARANSELTRSNDALAAANRRERERFALAMDAVKLFHGEVSKDFLLKEKPFEGLRTKLLRGAADFYGKLQGLLAGQTDPASRASLGRAYDALGELTEKIGSKPEALAVHRKALAVRRELAGEPDADAVTKAEVVRSLLATGQLQEDTGDPTAALASYEEARQLAENLAARVSAADPLQALVARSHQRIGILLEETGKPVEGLAQKERARAILQKFADVNPDVTEFQRDLAGSHHTIGWQLHQMGNRAEALTSYERAIEIRQKLADADRNATELQFELSHSHHNMGYLLQDFGKLSEALAAFERALALRQKVADANPNVSAFQLALAGTHANMGEVLRYMGQPGNALVEFERAMKIDKKLADANPNDFPVQYDLGMMYDESGRLLLQTGKLAEAMASYERAVAVLQKLVDTNPSHARIQQALAWSHNDIGALLSQTGKPEGAAAAFERGIKILQKLVDASPGVAVFQGDLAVALAGMGKLQQKAGQRAKAVDNLRRALALLEGLPTRTPEDYYASACVHALLGVAAAEPGSGMTAAEGLAEDERAMQSLKKAVAAGFRNFATMRSDTDLVSLRSRPDFQLLMMDLAFPDDPLAR
jgi:serine/threonine-protein kinase